MGPFWGDKEPTGGATVVRIAGTVCFGSTGNRSQDKRVTSIQGLLFCLLKRGFKVSSGIA